MVDSEDQNIILSICIPTYNRCNKLLFSLDNLQKKIKKHINTVELIVGNNGSVDNTQIELVKYQNLKVISCSENNGINPILLKLANVARGEYIWLLGDDDILNNNVLDLIINNLKNKNFKHSYFLIGKNYYSDDQLEKELNSLLKEEVYEINSINNELINKSGFISSHIVNRKDYIYGLIRSLNYNRKNAYATKFAYLYSHKLSKKIFCIDKAIFIGRITGEESFFINNPNLTIKTFLVDEFEIMQQFLLEELLDKTQLWMNAMNITNPNRLGLIIKAFLQKMISFSKSLLYFCMGFFIGLLKLTLIYLRNFLRLKRN